MRSVYIFKQIQRVYIDIEIATPVVFHKLLKYYFALVYVIRLNLIFTINLSSMYRSTCSGSLVFSLLSFMGSLRSNLFLAALISDRRSSASFKEAWRKKNHNHCVLAVHLYFGVLPLMC